jgi:hypothetical protein
LPTSAGGCALGKVFDGAYAENQVRLDAGKDAATVTDEKLAAPNRSPPGRIDTRAT